MHCSAVPQVCLYSSCCTEAHYKGLMLYPPLMVLIQTVVVHVACKDTVLLWGKNGEKWKPAVTRNQTQDTWLELSVIHHWTITTAESPALTILYTVEVTYLGSECLVNWDAHITEGSYNWSMTGGIRYKASPSDTNSMIDWATAQVLSCWLLLSLVCEASVGWK